MKTHGKYAATSSSAGLCNGFNSCRQRLQAREPKARGLHGTGSLETGAHREIKKLNKRSRKPPSPRDEGQDHLQHLLYQALLMSSRQRAEGAHPLPGQGDMQANLSPAHGADATCCLATVSPHCLQCKKEGSGLPSPQQDKSHRKHRAMADGGLSPFVTAEHAGALPPGMRSSSTAAHAASLACVEKVI